MIFPSPSSPEATDVPYQNSLSFATELGTRVGIRRPHNCECRGAALMLTPESGRIVQCPGLPTCLPRRRYYRPSCLSFLTVVWEVVSLSRVQGFVAYSDIYVTCYSLMGIATIDFIPVTLLFVLISRASPPTATSRRLITHTAIGPTEKPNRHFLRTLAIL